MYSQLHWHTDYIAFAIYPYISLSILILGCLYRYRNDPHGWNARSSELLDKESLKYASIYFHYGIIFALIGHVGGLLVPQAIYNAVGFKEEYHLILARYSGMAFGWAAFIGLLLLTRRRSGRKRIRANSSLGDLLTLFILLIVVGFGTYNVTFVPHQNVLHDVAPWLRSIFVLAPAPELLASVPVTYKIHFVAVWTLFAFYPFSRLVHITSAPVTYLCRTWILLRKRCKGLPA